MRRAVEAWADQAALSAQTLEDLQLALGEAVANGVEHAYRGRAPGECAFRVAWQPDGAVEVAVQDYGTWRPPPADPGFRGRGLALMHSLGQDVHVEPSPGGGTTVRFRVAPTADDAAGPDAPVVVGELGRSGDASAWLSTHRGTGDGAVVAVSGELDLASAEVLRPELLGVLAGLGTASATLDLRGTTYLASAGVGLLLEADAQARRAGLALRLLVRPGSSVARLLHVSRLDGVLTVDAVEQPGG